MRLSALMMRCSTGFTRFTSSPYFYAEHPFDTALVLLAVIGDGIAAEASVGHINHTVVEGGRYGVENLYFLYRAAYSRSVYVVAYLERLKISIISPPAKLDRFPEAPYPQPPADASTPKAGGFHPSLPMMAKARIIFSRIFIRLFRKVCTLVSIFRFSSILATNALISA